MSRRSATAALLTLVLLMGCDQLGNPKQFTTGPTAWKDENGHLVTTTRSFKDEKTIRRLVSEGMEDLDYADPSIGPSQTLSIVIVAARGLRVPRRNRVRLVTIFKLEGRPPIIRKWTASAASRRWSAAFALPDPPLSAVTSVAP